MASTFNNKVDEDYRKRDQAEGELDDWKRKHFGLALYDNSKCKTSGELLEYRLCADVDLTTQEKIHRLTGKLIKAKTSKQ